MNSQEQYRTISKFDRAFGKLIDRVGARIGYVLAVSFWTLAHVAHAWANSLSYFLVVRFAIGLGESGNFPAGLKAVAEWFPKRERAFATGIFNAGANVGAIVTPLIVPVITLRLGWRAAFLITGSFTVLWLVIWLVIYRSPRQHRRLGHYHPRAAAALRLRSFAGARSRPRRHPRRRAHRPAADLDRPDPPPGRLSPRGRIIPIVMKFFPL